MDTWPRKVRNRRYADARAFTAEGRLCARIPDI
jgi:hypothetical protein